MLQFDKDLASRSITSEDSKLSDYPAECLHLRVKGIGQEQGQRSEEKGNESADHCLHHKREMGPFPEARTGPEERTRLEAQLQAKLHCASAKRTTRFAEEWVADLVIGSAASGGQFEVGSVEYVKGRSVEFHVEPFGQFEDLG